MFAERFRSRRVQAPTVSYPTLSQREMAQILSGLMLALFLASLDQTIVATSLSSIATDFGSFEGLSWVVTGYLITSTTMTPIYGRLSDLFGRRKLLLFSVGLYVLASAFCALAQDATQLVAARLLQGLGGGGLRALSMATLADLVPPRERGRYQGYFSSVFGIASIAGPTLGGVLAQYLSWRWIFWMNLPLGGLALLLVHRNLKRLPVPGVRRRIDWPGAALIVLSAVPVLYGLSQAERSANLLAPAAIGPIVLGILFTVALVLRERATPEPMLPMRLFGNRIFTVASTLTFTMSMVMIGSIVLMPINYQMVGGLGPGEAGARLIPMTAGAVLGSFIAGQVITRTGRYRIFPLIGGAGMTVICAAIAWVGLGRSASFDLVATGLLGLSFGCHLSPVTTIVQNALEPRDAGVGIATATFFRLMGGAFGVAIMTTVLMMALGADAASLETSPAAAHAAAGPAFTITFVVAAGISAITLAAAFLLREIPLRGRGD